jgi:hypothetical protein
MKTQQLVYGGFYHIFGRGNHREALFKEDWNYHCFLDLYKKYIFPIADLYAYCLLPSHFHFLLKIKQLDQLEVNYHQEDQIWWQLRAFLGTYTKNINEAYQRSGRLFEGKPAINFVEKKGFIFDLITHIHQNPQTHGIVSNFRIWPFSSYQVYINQNLRSVVTKELFSDYELYNTISIIHEDYLPYNNQDANYEDA